MEISTSKNSFICPAFEFKFKTILKQYEVVCIRDKH